MMMETGNIEAERELNNNHDKPKTDLNNNKNNNKYREPSEKKIRKVFPRLKFQQQFYLMKCLQDDWKFFSRMSYQDISTFEIKEEGVEDYSHNQSLICSLNFFKAQKTLDYLFHQFPSFEDKNNQIIYAIQCNQVEFLKNFLSIKENKKMISKSHFFEALCFRNLEVIKLLKEKSKNVYREFEKDLHLGKSSQKVSMIDALVFPFYSIGSEEILLFFYKSKSNVTKGMSATDLVNFCRAVDISFVNASAEFKRLSIDTIHLSIAHAYKNSNLKLALELEVKFNVSFKHVFEKMLNKFNKDDIANILACLCREKQKSKFRLALSLLRSEEKDLSIFSKTLIYVLESQHFSYLDMVVDFCRFKKIFESNNIYLHLLTLLPEVNYPILFFDSLTKLIERKGFLEIKEIYEKLSLFFSQESNEEFKDRPSYVFSMLLFLHNQKSLHLINSSFIKAFNRTVKDLEIDTLYDESFLKDKGFTQALFNIIYESFLTKKYSIEVMDDLDIFFSYCVNGEHIIWSSSFNHFILQPKLTQAFIQHSYLNTVVLANLINNLCLFREQNDELYVGFFEDIKRIFSSLRYNWVDLYLGFFPDFFYKKNEASIRQLHGHTAIMSERLMTRLPKIMTAHFDFKQARKIIFIFLEIHLDKNLNVFNAKDQTELDADFLLFQEISKVFHNKFLSEQEQRKYFLTKMDDFLSEFLMQEGNKTESNPEKCRALFEKINYLFELVLNEQKSISLPKTEAYFKKTNPGFLKLLYNNEVTLVVTRKERDAQKVKTKQYSHTHALVPLESDFSNNNNNNNVNSDSNGKITQMLSKQNQKNIATTIPTIKLEDEFDPVELTTFPQEEKVTSKSTGCFGWLCCGPKQRATKNENNESLDKDWVPLDSNTP